MKPLTIDTKGATSAYPSAPVSPSPRQELPTPRRSATMGFSSKDLIAADLARDQDRPLHVPPMLSTRPGTSTLSDISIQARKLAPGILLDDEGNYYAMSKVIASGTFGNIRLGLKDDTIVSQVWVFKEVASQTPSRTQSATNLSATPKRVNHLSLPDFPRLPKLPTATPTICVGPDESLESEVNLMHKAHSPLAPHGVLCTGDRAIMMLPLADTNLFNVWSDIYQWSPAQRQAIVLPVMRQLMDELLKLHESGAAHRDLKPSNIFLTREGATFLGDYGMAMPFDKTDANVGTLYYLAPEVLCDVNHDKQKSDIFSVGSIITSLLIDTGYLWEPLWKKTGVVDEMRSASPSAKTQQYFVSVFQSYAAAFNAPQTPGGDARLKKLPMAKAMYKQLFATRQAYPELFKLIKAMQHPIAANRPSASQVVASLSRGALAPSENDGVELRKLLKSSTRPMRAAADAQALDLRDKLRDFRQQRSRTRRNSLDSTRRHSTLL